MCPLLDSDWGIATSAGGCATATTNNCPDRLNNWAADIVLNFGTGSINTDCRITGMLVGFTPQLAVDFTNQLNAWTLAFFGCPLPGGGGGLAFGLIPPFQSGHVFSTTDLKLLSDLYVQAVVDAVAAPSRGTTPPPLTQAQIDQINAQLARLAAAMPGTLASTVYTYSMCPVDAGSEGGG
jgi:hypothetical protein